MPSSGKPYEFSIGATGSGKPTIHPSLGKPHVTTTPPSMLPSGAYVRGYMEHDPYVRVKYPDGRKDIIHGQHGLIDLRLEVAYTWHEAIKAGRISEDFATQDKYAYQIIEKILGK